MTPLTPAQIPLTPSVTTSNGSAAALSGRTDLSNCTSKRHQSRENLVHLLSVAFLINTPPLVEDVFGRFSSINWLRAAKRADLRSLHVPDGSALSPDNIEDIVSIDWYADRYVVICGNHITKTTRSETKTDNYGLFTSWAPLRYRTLQIPTWIFIRSNLKIMFRIPSTRRKLWSYWVINPSIFYPEITFRRVRQLSIPQAPHRTIFPLWFPQRLFLRFP